MAYSEEQKNRAFDIYFETGGNLSLTRKTLLKEGIKLHVQTLKAWSVEKNIHGKDWEERRDEIRKRSLVLSDRALAERQSKTIENLMDMEDYLISQLRKAKTGTSSDVANAYLKVITKRDEMLGIDMASQKAKEAVDRLITALKEHPVIGPVFEKHWPDILEYMRTLDKVKTVKKAKRKNG
ncbi:MAG: hypothetical protein H7A25_22270 [Leptospiraceae bacterium]|nr:hypothetical protein [Leptospiraceae bacterium]MCP5502640.1 hypothetical protein [Leptospiraceae bacterium]